MGAAFAFALLFRPLALDVADAIDAKFLSEEERKEARGLPFRITKPPVGRNHMLNRGELRYIFMEERRLDMIKPLLNHTRETDVAAFSLLVQDFNKRAGKFRYEKSDYLAAKRDIKKYHLIIEDRALYELYAKGFIGFGKGKEISRK